MRKIRIMQSLLAILIIFCFYGLAFSGGGGPDPTPFCQPPLPDPDSGRFIRGEFTAAVDKIGSGDDAHYNVHAVLKMGSQTHLFSFAASKGAESICSFDSQALKAALAFHPCRLGIGSAFGLSGMPVIASLTIEDTDFCSPTSNINAMIRGEVLLRVVPSP